MLSHQMIHELCIQQSTMWQQKPTAQHYQYKSPPTEVILYRPPPSPIITVYFLEIHLNVILKFPLWSSNERRLYEIFPRATQTQALYLLLTFNTSPTMHCPNNTTLPLKVAIFLIVVCPNILTNFLLHTQPDAFLNIFIPSRSFL